MPVKPAVARLLVGATIAASALAHGVAQADQANAEATLRAASLAATCANCHGTNGNGVQGSPVSGLANLSVEYIKTNMIWFKTGQRPATVMHQLAKGYTDEQIDIIANYLGKKD
ncbi:cytochrome c [Limnobacter sp.]|uniref:c-type cytochrome n=1 Tax=Limnobacter sp. TaxID=2003368 RepID=UPI003515F264